jgi:N-succinyldiaminopimelate aminotransferase
VNPRIDRLHPYPFERLAALTAGVTPPRDLGRIPLSIGEPRHPAPAAALEGLADPAALAASLGSYPATRGSEALRDACAAWATRRFALPEGALGADAVLPVNGTREGLFSVAQALLDPDGAPTVLMPNPFYQIYEGAALLAGAEPVYVPCPEATGFLPDLDAVDARDLERCGLFYLCSPGNPSGACMTTADWARVFALADEHDFTVVADECYSELHLDEAHPPVGALQACAELGRDDFRRVLVFHSLSKRSNLPGLRSGFVAGDAGLIARFLRYRTYHGCALPALTQAVSARIWADEDHVRENRALYRAKFDAVLTILGDVLDVRRPEAGFYLWPSTPGDEETFTAELLAATNVLVLPGRYLSRPTGAGDPGAGRVRMALVATLEECVEAAERIRGFVTGG